MRTWPWRRRRVHRIARGDLITLAGWWRDLDVVRVETIQVSVDYAGTRISIECGPGQPRIGNELYGWDPGPPRQPRRRLTATVRAHSTMLLWIVAAALLLGNAALHSTAVVIAASAITAAALVAWVAWLTWMSQRPKTLRPADPAEPIIEPTGQPDGDLHG